MSTERFEAAVAWIASCGSLSELVDALYDAVAALGAVGCSLGVVDGSKIRQFARGFPDDVAEKFDTLAVDDPLPGPLAARTGAPQFLIDRASTLDRFPAAAAIIDRTDYEAAACLPLVAGEGTLGYVAAHYRGEHRFDPAETFLLRTLAATCAGTLSRLAHAPAGLDPESYSAERIQVLTSEIDGLQTAMQSRAVIEQAKGMVMHRFAVSAEGAWELLTRFSSTRNLKVRVLAERIVAGEPLEGFSDAGRDTALTQPAEGTRRDPDDEPGPPR